MKTPTKRCLQLAGFLAVVAAFSGYALAQEALAPLSFTTAQAAGGRANFASKCARCHGSDLEGGVGPALVGGVLDGYFAGPVGGLVDFVQSSMPQDMPGTLSRDETVTIVAFLASKNDRNPGGTPMPSDSAALGKMGFNQ
jgi:mono/diheme cytochrome c family protein